jgi:uncharacterized repeat protein (TIGR03843 family)
MSGLERSPADSLKVTPEGALEILGTGDVTVLGLLPYSSNYTFLARVERANEEMLAVYKPRRGERPLWDFPAGSLAPREVAAWLISEAARWRIVPPTVLRNDAPLGAGSLQLFVAHDPERHYFVLMEERLEDFAVFAAFDAVINNADRKAGHVIEDRAGKLWAVDHGLSFNVDHKLRTVIWQFAGERLGPRIRAALESLGAELAGYGGLYGRIAELLSTSEADATLARIESLLVEDCYPAPGADRPLPWPLI